MLEKCSKFLASCSIDHANVKDFSRSWIQDSFILKHLLINICITTYRRICLEVVIIPLKSQQKSCQKNDDATFILNCMYYQYACRLR